MRRRVPIPLAAMAVVLVAGGCSKTGQLEDKIAEQFKKEVNISNVKVTCPGNIKAAKGEEVQCTAEGDFSPLGVTSRTITLFVKFQADNSFAVTDFSADDGSFSISTSASSSSP
jgi:hypothetical protein